MIPAFTINAWLRYDLICSFLREHSDAQSFLEIGCGGGALAAHLSEQHEYVGYEPDPISHAVAAHRVGRRGQVIAERLPIEPGRSFDLVGAFEVLEHQQDDAAALAEWAQWVRPGGWLIVSVPANPSRFGACDRLVGHFRRYDSTGLLRLFDEIGLQEGRVAAYGFPLGYVLEFGRNLIAARRTGGTMAERTAASGRLFQPADRLAWAIWGVAAPFRLMQRAFAWSGLGTGLVAWARRPV